MKKGEVRIGMGDCRDYVPDHTLGARRYLDGSKTAIDADPRLRRIRIEAAGASEHCGVRQDMPSSNQQVTTENGRGAHHDGGV